MKLFNKKVTFKAGKLREVIYIAPSLLIYKKKTMTDWKDWAMELSFLRWGIGFKVELIND